MTMRRRDFITLLGGAAAAWPVTARAQQPRMPVIGYLHSSSAGPNAEALEAFRRGLAESGYVEGRDLKIEYRWAEGQYGLLPALATDLVRRQVNVIAACGTSAPGLAAKAATSTIPVVFQTGGDPVEDGLVVSMNRPGGNITGVSRLSVALEPKRLELLHELAPRATVIALLVNPANQRSEFMIQQMEGPARTLGLSLHVLKAQTEGELEGVFASLEQLRAGALLVAQEPAFNPWRAQIVTLASRYAIPAMYAGREYAAAGGLATYDAGISGQFRQVGIYVGRILKGEKPADLPIVQPTKFDLVLNLKTAKALGLTIPLTLQYAADEVIEQ
jgi:putative ABC transport system substrate-binding protein